MRKNSAVVRWSPRSLIIGGSLICVVIISIVALRPKPTVAPVVNNTDNSSTTITTSDGIELSVTFKQPADTGQAPAVILLHDYGQDRHEWDPYIYDFVEAGFATLSYDMRGFGESRLSAIPKDQPTHLRMLPDDLPAVIEYLQQQPNINQDQVIMIGAGVGANVAFVASGDLDGIDRVVLLSPTASTGVLDGAGMENFLPTNVLGVAGTTEFKDLTTIMSQVTGKKEEYEVDGGSRGVALLSHDQTLAYILAWLKS